MALERPLESLTDDEVLASLHDLLRQSRRVEAPLVAHIGEVHARHLYARSAASSMFCYCTQILHLSEGEAQLRIIVAKAAREHPVLLEMLTDGRLHLSGIAKLAPVLTLDNRDALLARAVHKSKRQIEEMVAELAPKPGVPSVMRKSPERPLPPVAAVPAPVEAHLLDGHSDGRVASLSPPDIPRSAATRRTAFEPLSPARYKIQFTCGSELRDDLERLQALMRLEVPDGNLAAIIGKAVKEMRQRLEARRYAQTKSPRKRKARIDSPSRYVAAATRRFVYGRDGSQCGFVDDEGRRCPERHQLQYHHRHAFGRGGGHDPENIGLMCGPHNQYLAELEYGREKMARYWRAADNRVRPRDESRSGTAGWGGESCSAATASGAPRDELSGDPMVARDMTGTLASD